MTKVLVLSYHYPPCAYGCSIRVVNFVKFLPQFGFQPVILTVEPDYYKDYSASDHSHKTAMPDEVEVVRTASWEPKTKIGTGLDTGFAVRQNWLTRAKAKLFDLLRHIGDSLLFPDVQILWAPAALNQGKKLLLSPDIDLIFAVGPPFSVLLIGSLLKKFSRKKLILDFKDMWVGRNQHEHRTRLCSLLSKPIEKRIVKGADRIILNTEYSYRRFVEKYPRQKAKFMVIPNGYEPQLEDPINAPSAEADAGSGFFNIVHSGTVDTDRNPEGFIYAVKELSEEQPEFAAGVKVCLSGKVHHSYISMVEDLGLKDVFEFKGYLNYHQNIGLLHSASLLLLLTTHDAPDAIPGKLYEYLAIKKPVLAITEAGASEELLLALGAGCVVRPQDKAGIKKILWTLYQDYRQGKLVFPEISIDRFNRRNQTGELARVFEEVLKL
jgi:glycosyltransferase involved in cell wall biosynthesis